MREKFFRNLSITHPFGARNIINIKNIWKGRGREKQEGVALTNRLQNTPHPSSMQLPSDRAEKVVFNEDLLKCYKYTHLFLQQATSKCFKTNTLGQECHSTYYILINGRTLCVGICNARQITFDHHFSHNVAFSLGEFCFLPLARGCWIHSDAVARGY